ncbi:MAG: 30S ribosomal protein S12 methylthiotransferase RimO [Gammaproteobacteria bacterium]|nr:30S ribosomal protein S12 methylthiotransferase RimO [Gammaproteobacteria bacterium]
MSRTIPKVGFVSLGCPKATVDAERILTRLRAEGYAIAPSYEEAELVIVNTCGFIDAAVEESLETIGEALAENGRVIVTGCLGAKEGVIKSAHPQVLAVTGPDSLEQTMAAIHQQLPPSHDPFMDLVPEGGIKLTPPHYAYIKIAEGCNQACSFCIIPSMRGRLVSRPIGEILDEAEKLVNDGVQELLIVAQDTAAYGVDVKYRTDFWEGRPLRTDIETLVRQLANLGVWLRLHYVYPYPRVDQLVALMAEGLLLPYLDIPLQHASPKILKAMRRPGDVEGVLKRIAGWREQIPEIALRSTFIVGFPGESEEDFELLLDFLREAKLDRAGAFTYSPVEGAAANELAEPVPEEVKQQRLERFMAVQGEISAEKLQQRIGNNYTVIIDEVVDGEAIGRSYAESPEIDGVVVIEGGEGLQPGDVVDATIIAADEHDLFARLEEDGGV